MPATLADLEKRLGELETAHKKTTQLALATDSQVQKLASARNVIFHFRGPQLEAALTAFEVHKQAKEFVGERTESAKKQKADEGASSSATTRTRWCDSLYGLIMSALKEKAKTATEAGQHKMATAAVEELHGLEPSKVLEAAHWHSEEPVDDKEKQDASDNAPQEPMETESKKVWRATLTFRTGDAGSKALDLFCFDCRAFSGHELIFHRDRPAPGGRKLAKDAAQAAGITINAGKSKDGRRKAAKKGGA
mmetsp:Transcript_46781/g.84485  ORF Transcript_46781/g.84485 Transcript_46781/m.84485 type:complete len:250 (-) Transcript_46781:246-995(-)